MARTRVRAFGPPREFDRFRPVVDVQAVAIQQHRPQQRILPVAGGDLRLVGVAEPIEEAAKVSNSTDRPSAKIASADDCFESPSSATCFRGMASPPVNAVSIHTTRSVRPPSRDADTGTRRSARS